MQKTQTIANCGLGGNSAYGSGGSMNNKMYRAVCCSGHYMTNSGRAKRRYWARCRAKQNAKAKATGDTSPKLCKGKGIWGR